MLRQRTKLGRISLVLATAMAVSPLAALTGCESLPGDEKTQGAVIGGVGGAAAGALIGGKDNRLVGALIGGAAGAGGGYLVGANWDKINGKKSDEAKEADRRAQERPARASDVEKSKSADLNDDGFVTLDEVVAMADAGLSDKEQVRRLQSTQQYFELTPDQEKYLRDHGVTKDVVVAMRRMNPEEPQRASDTLNRDTDRVETRTDRISGSR